jgi:PAS domain S-box-containing protein
MTRETRPRGDSPRLFPLKVTLVYAVVSALWILFSDTLLPILAPEPAVQRVLSIVKGWAFVAVTGAILYAVLQRYLGSIDVGERALRGSERRLERILATIPSIVILVDRNGGITFANKAAERVLRLKRDEMAERTYDDPAWRAETVDGRPLPAEGYPVARVLATGESVSDVRYAVAHPDGARTLLSTNASPLLDEQGALVAVVTASRDITDEHAAERKLVHVNRLYSLLSQMNHAIVRITDEDELCTEACRITVEFGQFRMAWIGLIDREADLVRPVAHAGEERGYLDTIHITVNEDDEGRGPVGTAARMGRTVVSNDVEHDPFMRPWAPEALPRGYRSIAAFPLKLEGEVFGVLGIYASEVGFFDAEETGLLEDLADDISFGVAHIRHEADRARTERDLRRAKDIFDHTGIGIVTSDAGSGRITFGNQAYADMHGYATEDLVGMPLALMFPPEERVLVPERIRRAEATGHSAYESTHLRSDGSRFPVSIEVSAVKDESGEVLYRIANVQDISERRAAEEELARHREHLEELVEERTAELRDLNEKLHAATEAKSRFLANMSHELRTPLNSVIGFSGLMLQGMTGTVNAEQEKQLGLVYRAGKQLLTLVNEILDLSKIEAGRMRAEATPFTLGGLIDEAADTVRPLAEEKGLGLRVTSAEKDATLNTDRDKVAQILLNLLTNAVNFTESGDVELDARTEEGSAVLTVTDTGIGIPPEDLERIFDEFEQAKRPPAQRSVRGTGLGLAISKRLTRLLGGTLEVASEPGCGSTFTLRVPQVLPSAEGSTDGEEGGAA